MDIIQNLNWVDYIFIAIFLFSIIAGFGRGFFREMFSLLILIAAFVVAVMFANPLALKFISTPGMDGVAADASQPISYMAIGVSFAVLFAGTMLLGTLLGYVLNLAFQGNILSIGNRIFGAIFGFLRGFIICLVLIFLVQLTPYGTADWWTNSKLVVQMQPSIAWVGQLISPQFTELKDKVGKSMDEMKKDINSSVQQMTQPSPDSTNSSTPDSSSPSDTNSSSDSSTDSSSSSPDTSGTPQ